MPTDLETHTSDTVTEEIDATVTVTATGSGCPTATRSSPAVTLEFVNRVFHDVRHDDILAFGDCDNRLDIEVNGMSLCDVVYGTVGLAYFA